MRPEDTGPDRFAAIADVHGNRWALEAVLEDIDRRGVRDVVNLGDHLFGPLDPPGTAELLMRLDFPSVAGNQDHDEQPLTREQWDWLAGMPLRLEMPGMLLFHGTPDSDCTYLLETVHIDGVTLANEIEIGQRLGGRAERLLLCGHTHIPRTVAFGKTLIVNPGSVGLQAYRDHVPLAHVMETGSPHARYAILERHGAGWNAEHRQIVYDWEAAAQRAILNGREDWAFRLRTGRAQ